LFISKRIEMILAWNSDLWAYSHDSLKCSIKIQMWFIYKNWKTRTFVNSCVGYDIAIHSFTCSISIGIISWCFLIFYLYIFHCSIVFTHCKLSSLISYHSFRMSKLLFNRFVIVLIISFEYNFVIIQHSAYLVHRSKIFRR
jgi:hypothetical protein